MWNNESFPGMFRRLLLAALIACGSLAIIGSGVFDDDDKGSDADDDSASRIVSKSVRTDESYTLIHETGAQLHIPLRAVPPTEDNFVGTMTFSIESDATPPSTRAPDGMTLGAIYRFGPGGFVFARPVTITLPVSDSGASGLTLMVYDDVRNLWIPAPSRIDPINGTVSAHTQHFSYWSTGHWKDAAWAGQQAYGWGTIHGEIPASAGHVYSVCIQSHALAHPDRDGAIFDPALAIMTAGASRSSMRLPQGTYTLGVTAWDPATGRLIGSRILGDYTIAAYDAGLEWEEGIRIILWPTDGFQTGLGCFATPTGSPGTGDVQVTLVWQSSSPADLDLHVTDPRGETVFFGNRNSASGGVIDFDNRCADYVQGRPENIYWLRDAPLGEYIVEVVYLSDCLVDQEEIAFDLTILNRGIPETHGGVISIVGERIEVARFTVILE